MRLFVDGRWFSQAGQGVATYLTGLHEQIVAGRRAGRYADIDLVFGVETSSDLPASLHGPGVEVVEFGRAGFARRLTELPFRLRDLAIDVAHFQYSCPLLKLGIRHIVTIHDVLFLRLPDQFALAHRVPRRLFYGLAARSSDAVLTVSEQSAADIAVFLETDRPIDILYNGVETSLRTAAPEPVPGLDARSFLLSVGRVEPRKNYRRLADAFRSSAARRAGMKLVIVGFCSREFRAEGDALAGDADIMWLDGASDGALNWLYAHARGFVFPSLGEGFGIPVLEALRAGLPCAVSDTYPLADVKRRCGTFPPLDVAAMARAIDELPSAAPPYGLDELWARYSWASIAEHYVGIVRRVADAPVR
jgi:glycosyltransferase involved in cell wall biosynthesis